MSDILNTMRISAAGMKTQGFRLRVIAENIANANSLPTSPGDEPSRRKTVTFKTTLDRETGMETVGIGKVRRDPSSFPMRYEPSHPAADKDGYVQAPNVNSLIESADMREAQRSYEANLNVIRASKAMVQATIEVLR
jgi:flagellar basal-body rod protein FlgC